MAQWPVSPEWTDLTQINNGNEFEPADGLTADDLNKIVKNAQFTHNGSQVRYSTNTDGTVTLHPENNPETDLYPRLKEYSVSRRNYLSNDYQCLQVDLVSTDLNNYKTSNIMNVSAGTPNAPDSIHRWFVVNKVSSWQDGNRYDLIQTAYRIDNPTIVYRRAYASAGNTWSTWYVQPTIDNIIELNNKYIDIFDYAAYLDKKTYGLYSNERIHAFMTADGTIRENASYWTTALLRVKAGESFSYRIKHATTLPIIAVYNDNKVVTSVVNGENAYKEGVYNITQDGYVRFCYHTSCVDGYVIFNTEIADNVKKYIRENISINNVPKMNILCLGDSIFGNDGEICEQLHMYSGATIYNGGFGGTSISIRTSTTDNYRYFDGIKIVDALTSGNFAEQDAVISSIPTTYYAQTLQMLKSLNLNNIDLITLAWGTNDYTQGKTVAQILEAYENVINTLHQRYPLIRILIITPIWRYFDNNEDSDTKTFAPATCTLKEIAQEIEKWAKNKRISVLNSYENMPLDRRTASTFFDSGDTVHLNLNGNKVYAHLINGKIQSLY